MQRRRFMKGLVVGSGTLAAAGLPYGVARLLSPVQARGFSQHLRPPGALADDAAFIAACIGCGLCGEVCPPRCILFEHRDGGKASNTPYINPEIKACILCNRCIEACPTDALADTPREQVRMGLAQIDRSACYPWVDRGVCGACVAICPLGDRAIGFEFANMYRPVVKENGCVGCGLCVEICPHPSLPIRIVEPGQGSVTRHETGGEEV